MFVGETGAIQALDAHSHPILGLTWTSTDTTVLSLSTEDPPVLTAIAPGHITVTAGDSSADVTVISGSALSPGDVLWSSPGDGSGIVQAVPAVPSYTGVADIFLLQNSGNVQAVRSDGTVAWTATVGAGNTLLPDFQGGLVVSAADTVKRFDGMNGQQVFAYSFVNPGGTSYAYRGKHPVAVHPDGTVFVVDGDSVVGIDSQTGAAKFNVSMEHWTSSATSDCTPLNRWQIDAPPIVGPSIIAGDGYFYMPYEYVGRVRKETYYDASTRPPSCNLEENEDSHLRLLRVGTDGSAQKIIIGDWTGFEYGAFVPDGHISSSNPVPNGDFESLITNADSGVLFTWSLTYPGGCSRHNENSSCFPITWDIKLTDTSTGITNSTGHTLPAPVLQAQDGTFIGNAINTDDWSTINLSGFNRDGSVKWTGPTNYQSFYATSDSGGIAESDSGQFVTFDRAGIITGQMATPPTLSWTAAYRTGSGTLDSVAPPAITLADTFAAIRGPISSISLNFLENGIDPSPNGNASGNGAAVQQEWFPQLQSCPGAQTPCPREAIWDALKSLRSLIGGSCPACVTYVFSNNKLGSDALGSDQFLFSKFLNRQPRLFDGTRSNMPMNKLCGSGFWNQLTCDLESTTVS